MKPRPFPVASLLALLLIGFAWVYMISREIPRGQIRGETVLSDANGQPLSDCDVYLTPDTKEDGSSSDDHSHNRALPERERRHTVTDKHGRFILRGVPVGMYLLSASAQWHSSPDATIYVEEGRTTYSDLHLNRSQPSLSIGDHQSTFTTAEKPYLPISGYTTLPGHSGKTAKPTLLHVKIWRTSLSEVIKRSDAASDLDALRNSREQGATSLADILLKPEPGTAPPKLVADETVPIHGADREGFFDNKPALDIAHGKPGLYLVKFSSGKDAAASYVMVTDLALLIKQSPHQLVAYTARLQQGTPITGATIRILHKGDPTITGTTGGDGVATMTPAARAKSDEGDAENDSPSLVLASYGMDEAVVSRSGGGSDDENSGNYVVHVVTDRTVYRPGDTVLFKGIARKHRDDSAPGYTVPRGVPVTIEMRDATGGLVGRLSEATNGSGSFSGQFETSVEGETGDYTLETRIGGEQQTTTVSIASYKKPEYAVTVTPVKKRYLRGEPVEMTVSAAYYFGAPVAGAKVHYDIYRDADWSAEYGSQDDGEDADELRSEYGRGAYSAYFGEAVADGDVKLDENGKAVVSVRTDIRHPQKPDPNDDDATKRQKAEDAAPLPQAESYTLTAEVTDESNRAVEADGAATVAAGDLLLNVSPEGYVATLGKASQIFVNVHDPDGKPVRGTVVTLAAHYEEFDKKTNATVTKPIGAPQTATSGDDGRALFWVTPPRTGDIRLVATATDTGGRPVQDEGGLWAAGDDDEDLDTDYGDLSLLTDKRRYQPGDTARVLVNASRTGQNVLLSVEGDRVYQTFSVPVRKRSTVVRVPVQAEWGPNVVLVANYVRDKKFATSETPLRVSIAARQLAVTIKALDGDRYGPGGTVRYAIKTTEAATGKPVAADCALSVVDESIYALREDDPKALRNAFYPRRSNRVDTEFSFSVEYLGDVNKAEPKIKARTHFKDTAYWEPDVQTGTDGNATVTVTLPDNLTTWRATVNAVTEDTAVGYGIGKVIASKPFLVRLETPRFLTAGDQSHLQTIVHNDTGSEQHVRVHLTAPRLHLTGDAIQSMTIASGGTGTADWPVTTIANGSQSAALRVTAWTVKEDGKPQYTDGIESALPIRAFGRADLTTFAGVLDTAADTSGGPLQATPNQLILRVDKASVPEETRLTLRVTPSIRGAMVGSVDYLVGFPYGCTEQTMSRFYPDLLVQKLGLIPDATKRAQLPRMVRDGISRLSRFQHSATGGWGWWENDSDDSFMTGYVLIGLSTAKAEGYTVDDALLDRGKKAAVKMVGTVSAEQRPFLLYALAEAGYDDAGTNILHAPFRYSSVRTHLVASQLPVDSLAYLVLLGRKLGQDYGNYYAELQRRAQYEGRLVHWREAASVYYDDCSDRMATALALRVLLAIDPSDSRIPEALRWLMNGRTDGYFGDTRDTSWVLIALCDYVRVHPEDAAPPSGSLAVQVNGAVVATVPLAAAAADGPETVLNLRTDALHTGPNSIRFVHEGTGTVFYSGVLKQTLAALVSDGLPPYSESGVTVKREVLRVEPAKVGSELWRLTATPITDGKFKQGDRLRVRLTITAQHDGAHILIEDPFPSGAEVTELGSEDDEVDDGGWNFWYDHVDVRDDRIAFFAQSMPKGTHVIEYNLRAQTPGVSQALPTVVQGMYDAEFHGESGTNGLEVQP